MWLVFLKYNANATSTFSWIVTFIIEKEGNQNPQGCMGFEGQLALPSLCAINQIM